MLRRQSIWPLVLGLLLSLLLHALAVVPFMMASMRSSDLSPLMQQARFHPEDFQRLPEEPPPPLETVLGIDAPTPSTMTWVGYEEYQEHMAALSEVEQAAFRENLASVPEPPAPPAAPGLESVLPPTPEEEELVEGPPLEETPEDTPERQVAESPPNALAKFEASEMIAFTDWLATIKATTTTEMPEPSKDESAEKPTTFEELMRHINELEESKPQLEKPPSPAKSPARDKPSEQPADQSNPKKSGETDPNPGEQADKETDATSTIEVSMDQLKLGKPIARPGLELKPRRPEFTLLTRVTTAPCNPLVEIVFGKDGVPTEARYIEGTCDTRLDSALRSSLYRWRAKGKKLNDLAKGETLSVRLRLLLR